MKAQRFLTLFLAFLCSSLAFSQNKSTKFWIFFQGKDTQNASLSLSPDALWNRYQQGIEIDERDFPVNTHYLQQLQTVGIQPLVASRWLNATSAYLNEKQIEWLRQQPFVKHIQNVAAMTTAKTIGELQTLDSLDYPKRQLDMIGVSELHRLCFTGKGVKLAMMDNGFLAANSNPAMHSIFEEQRLLYAYDFVDKDENVFEDCAASGYCRHGAYCFSIIGGKVDSVNFSGSAPDAQFMLFRTENDASETSQEEDNWVAAAEMADSLGAQVFSTSLGYSVFDDTTTSYKTSEMDGNTTIITKAADIASSKGIIVVNSAGNEGAKPWRIIIAPADGDSVLAIGAVNRNEARAYFSSQGYAADGRVKPDVMAMGEQTYLVDVTGKVFKGNGTSFSCPVMAGMMACLRQAYPKIPAYELQEWVKQSADRYQTPDSLYGYGIPDALKLLNDHTTSSANFQIVPNPNDGNCLAIWEEENPFEGTVRVLDVAGRLIYADKFQFVKGWNRVPLCLMEVSNGLYPVTVQDNATGKVKYKSKLLIRR